MSSGCGRCVFDGRCRGCSLVEGGSDANPGCIVYASYASPEQLGLYNTVPGGLVLRIVVPGAPPLTPSGEWWAGLANPRILALRCVGARRLLGLAESVRPDAVLVDGVEPLALDWVLDLLDALGGIGVARIVRSHGLLSRRRLRRSRGLFDVLLLEYSRSLAWLTEHFSELLVEAMAYARGVELLVRYDGSLQVKRMMKHHALAYPLSPSSLVTAPMEGVNAYDETRLLRQVKPHTYLHGDTTYTLLDTLCTRCRAPLVSRKPWGVIVKARRRDGSAICPSCGTIHRHVVLPPRRRRPPPRELIIL